MIYDAIIIGGGPAGLTAAIYLKRAQKQVVVIERDRLGGQVSSLFNISNYLGFDKVSGIDLSTKFYDHAVSMGVEFMFDTVKSIDVTGDIKKVRTSKTLQARNIILATGLPSKRLGVKGEKELYQKGVSYCALCDGNLYKGKDVAVVTNNPFGTVNAIYLAGICHKVHLIVQNNNVIVKKNQQDIYNQYVKNGNIVVHTNSFIQSINGKDYVISLTTKDNKQIDVSGVFIFNGYELNTDLVKDKLVVNKDGIKVNKNLETSVNGVYAIGDVRSGSIKQIACATADGVRAAYHILGK